MEDLLFWRVALLVVLLILSAFFAGSEVALFSLNRLQIDRLKERKGRYGRKIEELLATPQKLLVSIYIGNELANVAISAVTTVIALELFGNQGLAIAVGAGTFLLLVFGEISPKTFASHYNERFALLACFPLSFFITAIYPAQVFVTWLSGFIVQLLGGEPNIERGILTEEEILTLVEEGADAGAIDTKEREMIQNVFDLGDVTVAEVMTPRTDIFSLPVTTPVREAWDRLAETPFARAPVYRESIDQVEGILFKKDLLKITYPPPESVTLAEIIRSPFIVPETITLRELLREFKKRKTHIAIAMDEYGGVNGIATLDDIISELVGDSLGSAEANDAKVEKLSANSFRVDGSLEIEEFNEKFSSNYLLEDIETIGGYVFHLFGEPPPVGQVVADAHFRFTVEEVKGPRIAWLRIDRVEPAGESGGEESA